MNRNTQELERDLERADACLMNAANAVWSYTGDKRAREYGALGDALRIARAEYDVAKSALLAARQRERIEQLEAALKPFAALSEKLGAPLGGFRWHVTPAGTQPAHFTDDDMSRANRALAEAE